MATAVARPPTVPKRPATPPPATPPPQLTLNTSSRGTPAPIPNKHLPVCSPGPQPTIGLETPPSSPPTAHSLLKQSSLLDPPTAYQRLQSDPPLYSISALQLAKAVEHLAAQPLPDTKQVFPWLHGLHADNMMQLGFFVARRKALRKTPNCLRGIAVVKYGGDLTNSKLRGALAPDELLCESSLSKDEPCFIESDPKDGFSVRNFQIQACKLATLSDIIVYGDNDAPGADVLDLAQKIARAQQAWKQRLARSEGEEPSFNTFVVSDRFSTIESEHPQLVALDSNGCLTGNVPDLFYWERKEMCLMSAASEISHNVFLGPTPDAQLQEPDGSAPDFDVFIEASDLAQIADSSALKQLKRVLGEPSNPKLHIEFPSSGSIMPPSWSHSEVDGLLEVCKWMYEVTHGIMSETGNDADASAGAEKDSDDGITPCKEGVGKKVLIHCTDGYTESSLLGIAYCMYAEGLAVHEAWIRLHRERRRNFFAYPSDVALLTSIQARILQESPTFRGNALHVDEPQWLAQLDGSLPSRILPYMYLGNLNHANNFALLRELGITRVLSVGEMISWPSTTLTEWGTEDLLYIDRVQDNGVDGLTEEFERALDFIAGGRAQGGATLVHCRVGVSRSATICIAEVMRELGLGLPRAYCFVRARRLNVIIQPHLRFTYELMKWEERLQLQRGQPIKRDLEWASIAREIALMNKPYSRQS